MSEPRRSLPLPLSAWERLDEMARDHGLRSWRTLMRKIGSGEFVVVNPNGVPVVVQPRKAETKVIEEEEEQAKPDPSIPAALASLRAQAARARELAERAKASRGREAAQEQAESIDGRVERHWEPVED